MSSEELKCIIEDTLQCINNVNFALRFENDAKYRDILFRVRYDLFTLFNHYQALHIESIQDSNNDFTTKFINYHYE